ncbi:MAG: hypothetical protein JWM89_4040 [Acidimicrobiales bacterium]|nr:hypothetical protein [Acidimicrobiales bacterium]
MPDSPNAGWPGRVAVAILRSDPPEVFVASDSEVLGRVLALRLVAKTAPEELPVESVRSIRAALLAERWGDAVADWIDATGDVIDAYPDDDIWTDERLDSEAASFEIKLARIFEGDLPDARDG